jgi:RimJ/RimL family protein N-acetyltransferase
MMRRTVFNGVDAVRADGGPVRIRGVRDGDRAGLRALNANSSDRAIYLRFFTASRGAAEAYLGTLLRPLTTRHQAIVATVCDQIVGVAGFEAVDPSTAEVALLIEDDHQHQGIGTLLLEQLADLARELGYVRFVADVLAVNGPMIAVFQDLGYAISRHNEQGVVRIEFDLDPPPARCSGAEVPRWLGA